MTEPIDPILAGKLDVYTVPALPAGFADRLVAAALAEPASVGSDLPKLRRSPARRWLRGGVAGLGVIAVGMISISAAAMGYLGEPIRLAVERTPVVGPVVGKVIERVLPRSLHHAKHVAPAKMVQPVLQPAPAPAPVSSVADEIPPARLTPRASLADPETRQAWIKAHPRAAQRVARRRAEMQRRRAEAGLAPRSDMQMQGPERPLLRREGLTPMERRERIEQLRERRQMMRERRGMLRERDARPFRVEP